MLTVTTAKSTPIGPNNAASSQEEVATASDNAMNGRGERRSSRVIDRQRPPWSIPLDETEANPLTAATRTHQRRAPWIAFLSNDVQYSRLWRVRRIGDDRTHRLTEPPAHRTPNADEPLSDAPHSLSSGRSNSGRTSPRPRFRAMTGQISSSASWTKRS